MDDRLGRVLLSASSTRTVPWTLVSMVSSGESKLVRGKLCAARWKT